MNIERTTETIVTIKLDLRGGDEFNIRQFNSDYKVLKLSWLTKDTASNSHPITADAVDKNQLHWTLNLRWAELPDKIKEALIKATQPGDVPTITKHVGYMFGLSSLQVTEVEASIANKDEFPKK